ncbi:Chromosome (plasmid) partitioning protein ParB [Pseudoalteromonas luteoviolacea B = ATCC 29581]|nr:Chromosome (plasmid) partitioning protein ParB [Pseudoalteromonas luteoviolacea B = ATCC 29581]
MVKKRKNDTRIDPFSSPVEAGSLDALLEQVNVGDVITMPSPSDPTRKIRLTCVVIPHDQIESRTIVYGKNRRVQALLNEKSVADILPAIKSDGRNLHPALCWIKEDQCIVLAGTRRRKACIVAGADYVILQSSDFTDTDAEVLAVSSDQYIAPSLWELGQAYCMTKQTLVTQGKKGSYREIAAIEGVSHTAIADAIKAFESIPQKVLALYPTANHLGREAAKKLTIAISEEPEMFELLVSEINSQTFYQEEMSDDKKALLITKYLTTFDEKRSRTELILDSDFIKLQRNVRSGDVTIKIDNRVLTDKRLEQIQKLLATYN